MTWSEKKDPAIRKARRHSEVQVKEKFKDTLRTPIGNFNTYLSSMIKKAVAENPQRLSHGYTKYNAFWIDGDTIVPFNEHKKVLNSKNVISVHSHSSENWKDFISDPEPFDPLNGGDLLGLQHMVKYGYGDTLALISAYGELEYIKFTLNSDRSFITLSRKKLFKVHEIPYKIRSEWYDKYKKSETHLYREVMKSFCDHYRLEYKTELRWK